jgi:uncharacterized RDD family membrane protein YckC
MMICEKCEKELSSSIGACESCGHDPVLKRMDLYRERRNQQLTSFKQTQEPAQDARAASRTPRANAKDATLIRFPKRPATPPQTTPQMTPPQTSQHTAPPVLSDAVPAWKERLNLRLQEIREQREPSAAPARTEPKLDRNPVIINALNRIQRADYLQPITPLPHSRSSSAVELAPTPVVEVTSQPVIEAQAVAPTIPRPTIVPSFAAEPQSEAASTNFTTDEELGSEIQFEAAALPSIEDKPEPATTSHAALEAASLGKRVAAAVIDAEIIASSLLPLFGAYFFLSGWFDAPTILVPILVGVVLITVYFFVTYALAGRTMGMAWCNLHLASLSSNAETLANAAPSTITFTIRQAIMRALGGTISLLLFPLNIICIARSDDRLSLSDYLSDTQVVRIRK